MYFLKRCKKPFNHLEFNFELGSQTVFQHFCVQDLMRGSEIIAADSHKPSPAAEVV